jgi:ABC-type transporter Mla subunit MlaD
MYNFGYTARVGIVVVIAAIIMGYTYLFFNREALSSHSYTLYVLCDDASGLSNNGLVQMAGVKVGVIKDISIDRKTLRAKLTLTMMNDKGVPKIPVGSKFQIDIPVLGAVGTLDVVPPVGGMAASTHCYNDGDTIPTGTRGADIQASMANANEIMTQLKVTLTDVNKLIKDTSTFVTDPKIQGGLRNTLSNFDQASKNGLLLTQQLNVAVRQDNDQVASILRDSHKAANTAMSDIKSATRDMRGIMSENRKNLNDIIANLRDTTAALQGITGSANTALNQGGVSKNLTAIVANLKDTTAKLSAIAGDLRKVTGDAGTQSDLRATVHNLKETTEETAALTARINRLLGGKPVAKNASSGDSAHAPLNLPLDTPRSRIDMTQNTRDNRFRMDINGYLPMGSQGDFLTGGIFGAGDDNKLNIQYGGLAGAGSKLTYRYGVHASKLGGGIDYDLNGPLSLSVDLYDPNHSSLDILATYMATPAFGVIFGSDNVTHRTSGVIGLQYRP